MEILDEYLMEHGIITNKEAEQLGIKRYILVHVVKSVVGTNKKWGLQKESNTKKTLFLHIKINKKNLKTI